MSTLTAAGSAAASALTAGTAKLATNLAIGLSAPLATSFLDDYRKGHCKNVAKAFRDRKDVGEVSTLVAYLFIRCHEEALSKFSRIELIEDTLINSICSRVKHILFEQNEEFCALQIALRAVAIVKGLTYATASYELIPTKFCFNVEMGTNDLLLDDFFHRPGLKVKIKDENIEFFDDWPNSRSVNKRKADWKTDPATFRRRWAEKRDVGNVSPVLDQPSAEHQKLVINDCPFKLYRAMAVEVVESANLEKLFEDAFILLKYNRFANFDSCHQAITSSLLNQNISFIPLPQTGADYFDVKPNDVYCKHLLDILNYCTACERQLRIDPAPRALNAIPFPEPIITRFHTNAPAIKFAGELIARAKHKFSFPQPDPLGGRGEEVSPNVTELDVRV